MLSPTKQLLDALGSPSAEWSDLGSAIKVVIEIGMGPAILRHYQAGVGEDWMLVCAAII